VALKLIGGPPPPCGEVLAPYEIVHQRLTGSYIAHTRRFMYVVLGLKLLAVTPPPF
jgi:hypothetical protein